MKITIEQVDKYGGLETEAEVMDFVSFTNELNDIGLEITHLNVTVKRRGQDETDISETV